VEQRKKQVEAGFRLFFISIFHKKNAKINWRVSYDRNL